mgnify:CR=1 FL=1
MKEKTITDQILKYLKAQRCFAFKEHSGMYSTAGIPDIICCYKGQFMAFEVKTEKGKLSKLQEITIERIQQAGGVAFKVTSVQEVKDILGKVLQKNKLQRSRNKGTKSQCAENKVMK